MSPIPIEREDSFQEESKVATPAGDMALQDVPPAALEPATTPTGPPSTLAHGTQQPVLIPTASLHNKVALSKSVSQALQNLPAPAVAVSSHETEHLNFSHATHYPINLTASKF